MRRAWCIAVVLSVICLLPANSLARPKQTAAESQPQSTSASAPLTNKDVLEMLQAGMPSRAVVARIKASVCKFDKSAKALDELRAADVPYPVVVAMMQEADPDSEPRTEPPVVQPAPVAVPPTPPPPPVPPVTAKETLKNPLPADGSIEVTIADSTPFIVELAEDLTSAKIKTNNVVYFNVSEDLKINGITVIAKGAPARARVIDAKKSRSWGRGARVFMTMQDVKAVNGETLPVRAGNDLRGVDTNQKMKNAAIATGQISWALAPVWGLKHGGSVGVPAGTKFEVYVYGTRKVSVNPAAQTPPPSN